MNANARSDTSLRHMLFRSADSEFTASQVVGILRKSPKELASLVGNGDVVMIASKELTTAILGSPLSSVLEVKHPAGDFVTSAVTTTTASIGHIVIALVSFAVGYIKGCEDGLEQPADEGTDDGGDTGGDTGDQDAGDGEGP